MDTVDSKFIEKITRLAIEAFYQEKKIKPIDAQVEFVDDLYRRRLELAVDEKDVDGIEKNKEFISTLNGTMVLPATLHEKAHILISNNAIDENALFIGTIIHELTHVHDYYDFAKHHAIEHLGTIQELSDFPILYFWSEFHARRTGYYFYRKIVRDYIYNIKDEDKNEDIRHIKETECPFQLETLTSDLIKTQDNPREYMYNLMQFLGRFSVWQDLFPEHFNKKTLPRELVQSFGYRITDIYDFLYTNSTFEDIKNKFGELQIKLESFEPSE